MRLSSFVFVRKRPGPLGSSSGFTLLEVLFAVAVFTFGITYASGHLVQSMRQKAGLNARSAAYYLASGKIEEAVSGAGRSAPRSGVSGNVIWEREFKASSVEGMSEVVVVVKWTESGRNHDFTLRTLVRDR